MVPSLMSHHVLFKTIERFLAIRGTSTKAMSKTAINSRCQELLEKLETKLSPNAERPIDEEIQAYTLAKQFVAIILGLDVGGEEPRMTDVELNALHKLLAHGIIDTTSSYETTLASIPLIPIILSRIHRSLETFDNDTKLAAVKALLTLGTSTSCDLHGEHLRQILKILLQIFSFPAIPSVIQSAARAAISQISNDRITNVVGDHHSLDRDVVLGWACEALKSMDDVGALSLALGVVYNILKNYSCNPQHFIAGLLSILDKQPELFPEWLQIVEALFRAPVYYKEALEMIVSSLLKSLPGTSTANQLEFVEFLKRILSPQLLLDLFVNYDCELTSESIVEPLLIILCQLVSRSKLAISKTASMIDSSPLLRLQIECGSLLINVVQGLLEWYSRMVNALISVEPNPTTAALNPPFFETIKLWKSERKEVLQIFNTKGPRKGIEMGIQKNIIGGDGDAKNIAQFLRFTPGLSKLSIGEYLGEVGVEMVIESLLDTIGFEIDLEDESLDFGRYFVKTLHKFLQLFRLPGESQKISRILECFARKFIEEGKRRQQQQDRLEVAKYGLTFDESLDCDCVYKLSYSTMMLNTDLHSPQVKSKMDLASWIRNNRGIAPGGGDLNKELLESIYEVIKLEEIRLDQEFVQFPLPFQARGINLPWISAAHSDHLFNIFGFLLVPLSECLVYITTEALLDHVITFGLVKELVDKLVGLEKLWAKHSQNVSAVEFFDPKANCAAFLGRFFEAKLFFPLETCDQQTRLYALNWIYSLTDQLGNDLGIAWGPILQCLSRFDRTIVVDSNHNLREIDLSKFDGSGLLFWLQHLSFVPRNSLASVNFVRHYSDRLASLPSSMLEKIIQASYPPVNISTLTLPPVTLFSQLGRLSSDTILYKSSFQVLEQTFQEQMPLVLSSPDKALLEFLSAFAEFALLFSENGQDKGFIGSSPHLPTSLDTFNDISLLAINRLQQVGELLYSRQPTDAQQLLSFLSDDDFYLRWYAVLSSLSRVAIEHDSILSSGSAITALFALLRQQGHRYSQSHWKLIFRSVLLPVLADLLAQRGELASTLLSQSLRATIDIIIIYKLVVLTEVFESVLRVIEDVIGRKSEVLSRAGLFGFYHLITGSINIITPQSWMLLIRLIEWLFDSTLPSELMGIVEGNGASLANVSQPNLSSSELGSTEISTSQGVAEHAILPKQQFRTVNFKLSLHLLVIQMVRDLCFPKTGAISPFTGEVIVGKKGNISSSDEGNKGEDGSKEDLKKTISILDPSVQLITSQLEVILACLSRSHRFADDFNQNSQIRENLWKAGFIPQLENLVLVKQETSALSLSIGIRFRLFEQTLGNLRLYEPELFRATIVVPLFSACRMVIDRFLAFKKNVAVNRRNLKSWSPLVVLIFTEFCSLYQHLQTVNVACESSQQVMTGSEAENMSLERQVAVDSLKQVERLLYQEALKVFKDDDSGPGEAANSFLSLFADRYLTKEGNKVPMDREK